MPDFEEPQDDLPTPELLTGLRALAQVPLTQLWADRGRGSRTAVFASGYPGSPLGRFDQEFARVAAGETDVVHLPGHNEELAATAVLGSQVAGRFGLREHDGVLGVWYGKAPGLDRAADAIRHAQYAGTSESGGVLAYVGDDPSNKSSTLPSSSAQTLAALGLPVLEPGTVQEILDLGWHGVALSRLSGLWTAFRVVTSVADAVGTAVTTPVTPVAVTPGRDGAPNRPSGPTGVLLPPVTTALEQELTEVRLELARHYLVANDLNRVVVDPADAKVGIIAVGRAYHETRAALDMLGLDEHALPHAGVRVLHVRMTHPLDAAVFRAFARGLAEVMVVEDKRPLVENFVLRALHRQTHQPVVTGKTDEAGRRLLRAHGVLDAAYLVGPLYERLSRQLPAVAMRPPRRELPLTVITAERTPYVCSGCPHSTGTRVPAGSRVGTAIGCGSLTRGRDESLVGSVGLSTQMGGEGAAWLGIAPFVADDHLVQHMGDGTYLHSGQLAVQAAV
ncbi:hypothetical protein [Actinophytocola sp.]|uniref:hypothetical protein n=1 Tax=Actinophytocola sp. TaxID=1872138 RepID=UPI0038998AA1